jgi:rubrerythrin
MAAEGARPTRNWGDVSEAALVAIAGHWQCRECTTAHEDLTATACSVCGAERVP